MTPIITLTLNPAIDKNTRVERVVADDKLRCDAPRREPGGGGINVARVIHRLGGAARALYTSGGPTGTMLEGLLDGEDVAHTPVAIDKWTRENMIVHETSTDRQFRFGMPGPTLTADEFAACLDALRPLDPSPDYLVASGSLPPGLPDDTYAAVAETAHDIGARTVLDTSGPALRAARAAGWYLLKPNLRELEQLTGASLVTDDERIEAARDVIARGWCEVVVLSMGAAGALLITADRAEHVRTPTVPIKSRVGAGDSMVGGLTLALARGHDLRNAVRFGVAAGAAAVMTPGTALCRRADTESLFEQMSPTATH
jgi:6-phosphofructokinase 2